MTLTLNPQQDIAVNHIEGPLLVLAGAGSGKTHVVTNRIAHLIEIGVPASEIVAVTFTNKAAQEMSARVKSLCHQHVLTCTFHSLCARILRESIHHLGFKNDFTIYDQSDSENLLKVILKGANIELDKSLVKSFKTAISNAKNDLVTPQMLAGSKDQGNAMLYNIYNEYQRKLKEYNALDFDDLLFMAVKLLEDHKEVKELYQQRWSFFSIDEYQDTNKAQYRLTRLLTEKSNNLFVVGDPDQSIYSFRGANIQNILNFKRDYPEAVVVPLEQNYRSTSHILSAANHLIQNNESRYEKKLWSDLGDGEKVRINVVDSEQEEAQQVIEKVLDHHETTPLSEMVIFYRTNSQSRIYEDMLIRKKLPYQIIGGLSFYARKEIKDLLAFLRVINSPADFISFERTINIPKRGFGNTTIINLRKAAGQLQIPIIDLCEMLLKGESTDVKLSKKQYFGLSEYIKARRAIIEMKDAPLNDILFEVLAQFRYIDYLKLDEETFVDRKANVDELIAKAIEWADETEGPTLAKFLEELTLKAQIDEHNPHDDKIKLMTLHNSKGLEFPIVFMVGMEEDLFPHVNCKETPEQLEEERRLAYVGMTRAQKHLYLSASRYRMVWGSPRIMKPSRFLSELPEEHIQLPEKVAFEPIDGDELPTGTVVHHKSFGRGVIRKAYQTSLGLTYDVYFPGSESIKTLIAKYAKLSLQ